MKNYLEVLESESIKIIREGSFRLQNSVILFSGGKDSTVLLYLMKRAFWPDEIPYPVLHIDTGHNFLEVIEFRDKVIAEFNLKLIVGSVEETIKNSSDQVELKPHDSRNELQSLTLMEKIKEFGFDALYGGARRDEEKARAKERIFSLRNSSGSWDPLKQRPELWNNFNTLKSNDEHFRIFPLSNWTEIDIWKYIKFRNIEVSKLYYSHKRKVFRKNNILYSFDSIFSELNIKDEKIMEVRFRTIGDITCTGAIPSKCTNTNQIIEEIENSNTSERGLREDDKTSSTAMEDRKLKGYF